MKNKKNVKAIKASMTAIMLSMAVFVAGCGGGAQTAGGGGDGADAAGNEAGGYGAQTAGNSQEADGAARAQAYLSGIQAADYVKLGEYKGIKVVQPKPEVSQEDQEAYLEYLLCFNPDRPVIDGDTVNIDYAGTLDGVAFDGGTAAGQDLTIGSGRFVPGFEEGLIGARVGDTVEVPLTFPENYHEGLAGEDVVFTVTVNSIRAAQPEELTDAFVERQGLGLHTVEEFRQHVYDSLYENAVAEYETKVEDAALQKVLEGCEFIKEPPQAMVERHMETLKSNLASQAAGYGMTLAQFMELYFGMKQEAYEEQFHKQAVEYAKQQIAIQAVADAEGLQVTEEEFQQEVERLAEASGAGSAENMLQTMDTAGYREYMLSIKVLELLRENAAVSEK